MPIDVKILFTVFSAVIAIAICFIDPKADNAVPDWLWKLGRRDPVRNLLYRSDGSLRRYAKLGTLIWFTVFLLSMWLFV